MEYLRSYFSVHPNVKQNIAMSYWLPNYEPGNVWLFFSVCYGAAEALVEISIC
jgi:hypothetical protein